MSDDQDPLARHYNSKLVETKERWARDGRGLTGESAAPTRRLPPGQHETADFPVLDLGIQPSVRADTWSLAVGGEVERPLSWTWADFMAQPQVEMTNDIHCVTTWSRYDNHWKGVSARHLLALVRPRPAARFVLLRSYDGYTTNLPLEHFAAEDVMLAHSWEGEPLTPEHGGPVRVVVPKLYFWKSAKWLRAITLMAKDAPGTWELRGYHDVGDPWQEERYR